MIGTLLAVAGAIAGVYVVGGIAGWAYTIYRIGHPTASSGRYSSSSSWTPPAPPAPPPASPGTPTAAAKPASKNAVPTATTTGDRSGNRHDRKRSRTKAQRPDAPVPRGDRARLVGGADQTSRILALTFYREMRRNGYTGSDIVALAAGLVDEVTRELPTRTS